MVATYSDDGSKTPVAIKPLEAGEQNIVLLNTNPKRGVAFLGLVDDMGDQLDTLFRYVPLARTKDAYDYLLKGYLAFRLIHPNLVSMVRHAKLAIEQMDPSALGFVIGKKAVGRVPVLEHFEFSKVDLKNLGGSMASSGAVALFHVEGVTPEAPDLKSVFDGEPEETITITQKDLDGLRFEDPQEADMVVFGCPQMTFDEALELAPHFAGKRVKKPTWFCMVPAQREKFEATREHEAVRAAGVEINCWCPLAALSVRLGRKTVLTNSGKLYYYLDGAEYGNRQDCLLACGVAP